MRFFRLLLPVVAVLIMMFAEGNQTALNVAYVMLGVTAAMFVVGIISDARKPKDRD